MITHQIQAPPPTRVIITGDLHFRSKMLDDQQPVATWIAQQATPGSVVILNGDLTGRECPHVAHPSERNAVGDLIQGCLAAGATRVIVILGNHDLEADWLWLRSVPGVVLVTRPETVLFDGLALHCIPYPHRSWLAMSGRSASEISDAVTDALGAMFAGFAASRPTDALGMVVGHFATRGAVTSTGQPLIGTDVEVPAALLRHAGVGLAALNHIHMPQAVKQAGVEVVHVGSPWPADFGEEEEKSVLVVEIGESGQTWRREPTPCVVRRTADLRWVEGRWKVLKQSRDLAPIVTVTAGQLTEESKTRLVENQETGQLSLLTVTPFKGSSATIEIGTGPAVACTSPFRLRLRLHYDGDHAAQIDEDAARAMYPGALSYTIEPLPTVTRRERAPEVATATTPRGRFLAFERSEGREVEGLGELLDEVAAAAAGGVG